MPDMKTRPRTRKTKKPAAKSATPSRRAEPGETAIVAADAGEYKQRIKEELDHHDPALYVLYEEIQGYENSEKAGGIQSLYERGRRLVAARKLKSGDNGAGALAHALKYTRGKVSVMVTIANRITPQEVQRFVSLTNGRGERLTWHHLHTLAGLTGEIVSDLKKVSDKNPRALALKAACEIDGGLSVDALETYILSSLPSSGRIVERHVGSGRPFSPPKSFRALLHSADSKLDSFVKFSDQVVKPHFHRLLDDTPPDKIDENVLQELQDISAKASAAIHALAMQKAEIDETAARLAHARGVKLSIEPPKRAPAGRPAATKTMPPGRKRTSRPTAGPQKRKG